MNIFEETLSVLKSKVKTRQLLDELHPEDIERIIKRLSAVLEEKELVVKTAEENVSRKREAMKSVLSQMKELGLSANDLVGVGLKSGTSERRKYASRNKYIFTYQLPDGEQREWRGAVTGRTPLEFSQYLERTGKNRKDCIASQCE